MGRGVWWFRRKKVSVRRMVVTVVMVVVVFMPLVGCGGSGDRSCDSGDRS